jgi:uncharacterized surface protein with fasciclin (FAS1) repeats
VKQYFSKDSSEIRNHDQAGNALPIVLVIIVVAVIGFVGYTVMNKDKDTTSTASTSQSMTKEDSVDGVTVGGAKMVRTKDIVDNAVNAKNVTTVVAAVKAAGLVDTLKGEGPFTVFAPDNAAFEALPAGTVDNLLKAENKAQLVNILTYHVVPGTYTSADLKVMAAKGESVKTVQGETLSFTSENNEVKVVDSKGSKVSIETPDVISSNGVTHVIKAVLMP